MAVLLRRVGRTITILTVPVTRSFFCHLPFCGDGRASIASGLGVPYAARHHVAFGDGFVRIGLVENRQRVRQAARNVKSFLTRYHNVMEESERRRAVAS